MNSLNLRKFQRMSAKAIKEVLPCEVTVDGAVLFFAQANQPIVKAIGKPLPFVVSHTTVYTTEVEELPPIYQRGIHKTGDTVRMSNRKGGYDVVVVPELDDTGEPI